MIVRIRTVVLLIATLLSTGCGTRSNLAPNSAFTSDDNSAVLVMGLKPRSRIHLLRGSIENDMWVRPIVDVAEVNLFPENDYVVVKVKPTTPNEPLGVSLIFPEGGGMYGPCWGSNGPVFFAKAGAVNYVGDLTYSFDDSGLRFEHTIQEEKVRTFLKASYPGYEERLIIQPVRQMKVKTGRCNSGTTVIPIFIPSR